MSEIGAGLLLWGAVFLIHAFTNPHDDRNAFYLIAGIVLMIAGGTLLYR